MWSRRRSGEAWKYERRTRQSGGVDVAVILGKFCERVAREVRGTRRQKGKRQSYTSGASEESGRSKQGKRGE
jgi:hypothetical protein